MKFMHTFAERVFQAVQKKWVVDTAEMMTFKGLDAPGGDFGCEEDSAGLLILPKLGHWCEYVEVQIKTMESQCIWSTE